MPAWKQFPSRRFFEFKFLCIMKLANTTGFALAG